MCHVTAEVSEGVRVAGARVGAGTQEVDGGTPAVHSGRVGQEEDRGYERLPGFTGRRRT